MAGIYIHIPYCKQACTYCNFHFSIQLKTKDDLLDALLTEIDLQKIYLGGEKISTIYFGGGTPSILTTKELGRIFDTIEQTFELENGAEITLEANPDDLDEIKLRALKATPINRLSIGVQSFRDEDLKWMNRAHNAQQADYAVKAAQDKGFENITIDLIYGLPELSNSDWVKNLAKAFQLQVPHISSYSLTVEPNTALDVLIKKGKSKAVDENKSAEQMIILMRKMKEENFTHYEISNFCRDNLFSRHNTSYWKGEKYLGIGPSAHSFNHVSRQWNVANNIQYIRSITEGKLPFEIEMLSEKDRYNEYVMTSLRTMWGADSYIVKNTFNETFYRHFLSVGEKFVIENLLVKTQNSFVLTDEGRLIADRIILDFFTA
jgi:oxygen-independent coproporphyrinogen III oxidase